MKKFLSIILCVVVVAGAFVACSNSKDEVDNTPGSITTDDAIIKESDAIELIKSYSSEELGLTDEQREECSFMVANSGVELDGKFYVKVIATVKVKHEDDGQVTYTFDNKGEYYISYDGKKILQKDMTSEKEKFNKMEVKPVPTTEKVTDAE